MKLIQQSDFALNSRSESFIFDEWEYLPLFTAPMTSVVNEKNKNLFNSLRIHTTLPRNNQIKTFNNVYWTSVSVNEAKEYFLDNNYDCNNSYIKVLIDTAVGNTRLLLDIIRLIKEKYQDNVWICSGNVSSIESYKSLLLSGCDFIRVGVGGGLSCNTAKNTGLQQENLATLIGECVGLRNYLCSNSKIIADGISTFGKWCIKEFDWIDNYYAVINTLLYNGADYVMLGSIFAQCSESAGLKFIKSIAGTTIQEVDKEDLLKHREQWGSFERCFVQYAGMSTQEEQKKYKELEFVVKKDQKTSVQPTINKQIIKPSEGSVQQLPVRWTLYEWLNGSLEQDKYPYLMGWVNSIKSAMSYTNSKTIKEFKAKQIKFT